MNDNTELERQIGYRFDNRKLMENALTHSSYASEHNEAYAENNERLEFIGDAFLDAIVGVRLYRILSDEPEGVLSKLRAEIVCERSLAGISRKIGLGRFLFLGHGEEQQGGRNKDSILADAMEAMIGAVVIDSGYDAAEQVVLRLFGENIKLAIEGRLFRDYKTKLQERLQERYKSIQIRYVLDREEGPDHAKTFHVHVEARNRVLGCGAGRSKKEAEQEAAREVLSKGEL